MNNRLSRIFASLGPFIGLAFVIGLFSLSNEVRPFFLTGGNFKIILTQTVIVAVGALGMTLIIVSAGIDLSVGSLVALTSVVAARLVLGMAAPELTPADIRDPAALFSRLRSPQDSVSRFVVEKLSDDGRRELATPAAAPSAIVRDLNALVMGPELQAGGRFEGVTLRSGTRVLLAQANRSRDAQARLNRLLLEDAFPGELTTLRPFWVVTTLTCVMTILAGGVVGMVNGVTIARFRMLPFIVTLGMMGVVRGAAKWMGKNQTVNPPASPVNDLMALTDPQHLFPLPLGVWVALALAVVMAVVLRRSVFGRYIFAIGSNEATARLCGIRVQRQKILIYSLAGLFFGLAGLMQFSRLTQGDPSVAIGLELDIIAAVVIGGASLSGGTGSIAGSMIGAFMMAVLRNGSNQMGWPTYMQEIIIGIVIVLAVGLDKWRQIRSARRTG